MKNDLLDLFQAPTSGGAAAPVVSLKPAAVAAGFSVIGTGGDYPDINTAYAAGVNKFWFEPGTHYLTADMALPYDRKMEFLADDPETAIIVSNGFAWDLADADLITPDVYNWGDATVYSPGDNSTRANANQNFLILNTGGTTQLTEVGLNIGDYVTYEVSTEDGGRNAWAKIVAIEPDWLELDAPMLAGAIAKTDLYVPTIVNYQVIHEGNLIARNVQLQNGTTGLKSMFNWVGTSETRNWQFDNVIFDDCAERWDGGILGNRKGENALVTNCTIRNVSQANWPYGTVFDKCVFEGGTYTLADKASYDSNPANPGWRGCFGNAEEGFWFYECVFHPSTLYATTYSDHYYGCTFSDIVPANSNLMLHCKIMNSASWSDTYLPATVGSMQTGHYGTAALFKHGVQINGGITVDGTPASVSETIEAVDGKAYTVTNGVITNVVQGTPAALPSILPGDVMPFVEFTAVGTNLAMAQSAPTTHHNSTLTYDLDLQTNSELIIDLSRYTNEFANVTINFTNYPNGQGAQYITVTIITGAVIPNIFWPWNVIAPDIIDPYHAYTVVLKPYGEAYDPEYTWGVSYGGSGIYVGGTDYTTVPGEAFLPAVGAGVGQKMNSNTPEDYTFPLMPIQAVEFFGDGYVQSAGSASLQVGKHAYDGSQSAIVVTDTDNPVTTITSLTPVPFSVKGFINHAKLAASGATLAYDGYGARLTALTATGFLCDNIGIRVLPVYQPISILTEDFSA